MNHLKSSPEESLSIDSAKGSWMYDKPLLLESADPKSASERANYKHLQGRVRSRDKRLYIFQGLLEASDSLTLPSRGA